MIDYYEFLQISPNADAETIHRVYRYLAARLHPDNPDSGNPEMFRLLRTAYEVLSDPAKRSEYDAMCRGEGKEVADPLSADIDFMDQLDGEVNRRVALLAVLYMQRRSNPRFPEVSLAEIERRMGFPRDYLDFTTWYLGKKNYILRADNSDFTLTAEGVDFIESQRAHVPVLNKLLTDGKRRNEAKQQQKRRDAGMPLAEGVRWADRRSGTERRVGAPDHRTECVQRRVQADRRTGRGDRRQKNADRRAHVLSVTQTGGSTRVQ